MQNRRRPGRCWPTVVSSSGILAATLLVLLPPPPVPVHGQEPSSIPPGNNEATAPDQGTDTPSSRIVVTATRLPTDEDRSPAAVTVIPAEELAERQTDRVADALRAVPGLNVVQSGAPGQLTSVFTRGLESRHTQVLIDGIPFNQGLAGLFNFADLTGDGVGRIEVQRGPQSTLYGPRALAGAIQIFTRRGDELDPPRPFTADVSAEGGSFATFRERVAVAGVLGAAAPTSPVPPAGKDAKESKGSPAAATAVAGSPVVFDYSAAFSRVDTDNDRPNNQYRNTVALANLGLTLRPLALTNLGGQAPRLGVLVFYANSDAGSPNTVFDPRPKDNLLTERQLYAPNLDWQATSWWHHRLVLAYDKERQVNDPNEDGFVGPTRAQFNRYQLDYQNDVAFTRWLTLTTGVFYENVSDFQRRPLVSQAFGPQPQFLKDFTENAAGFAQFAVTPFRNALLVAGGRYDHFNLFGDVGTYRFADSYLFERTATTLRASVATGYAPPTPQDRIFAAPTDAGRRLDPEESFGYDFGFEQGLFRDRLRFGANYFHDDLSNVIGFNNVTFQTLNLGSARTLGVETFARWEPVRNLFLRATYTYLDAVNTSSSQFGNLAPGARLPRRARNEAFASVSYRFFDRVTLGFEAKFVNGREDIRFDALGNPVNFDLGGYTLLRLLADAEVYRNVHVYGRIENLGDQRYEEVYGYPALRRGFFGGASVRF